MDKFKDGDLVKLNSGGPVMTVNGKTHSEICCVWFNQETNGYNYAQFVPAVLKTVTADEVPGS